MSFEYYTTWWIKSKKHLEDLYTRDQTMLKKAKPIADRRLANELVGGLYAKYCMLVQELDACLDQLAQPQKKMAVRKLVDSAMIRLNELNEELRNIDISEYHYIDGQLIELKLVPYNIEILHPYLMFPRPFDVADMVQKYKNEETVWEAPVLEVVEEEEEGSPPPPAPEGEAHPVDKEDDAKKSLSKLAQKSRSQKFESRAMSNADIGDAKPNKSKLRLMFLPPPMPPEELHRKNQIILIQNAERCRQTRVYFMELFTQQQRTKGAVAAAQGPTSGPQAAVPKPDPEKLNQAATVLEKNVRAWSTRELMKWREIERRFLIGMYEPSWRSTKEFDIFEANLEKRRQYRDQRMREYIDGIEQEKARLLRVVAPGLLEDIGDEIREWFHVWYKEARCFDVIPPEEKGGTILVVRGETMTPKEFIDDVERKRREKAKGKNKAKDKQKAKELAAKKKKEEADRKKKEAEKKKKAELQKKKKKLKGEFEFEFGETKTKELFDDAEEQFEDFWDQRNDFDNPLEKHYMDIITEKECYELQLQVRKTADELMRVELELLNDALLRDKGKKGKKKKKKGKKKGKRKGKKGKKKKDMTADRTTEDLFQELIDNGIIRTYPKTYLDAFKGDFSFKNTELRYLNEDPPAEMLDVRQAVVLNCILPLGVEVMKKPRSALIVGPSQCGKHILANAIFTRTQSVLFDLSPEVTAGKYPGKKGMVMLLHLINKMSRLLQPSIIYFEAVEKIFYKKVPKDEKELDPKRIGKKLVKGIIKTIKPEDRVMVLGLTSAPWLGQLGKMKKSFDRVILVPRPDYGSVYLYWRDILRPYHGVDRNFNFSSLATLTKYYPYPVLRSVVERVLTPRRIIQLKYKPLRPEELYEVIVSEQIEPITDKIWKKFIKFYYKTPLGKDRKMFNSVMAKIKEKEAKANQRKR